MSKASQWCQRCGGPLADAICENCISAEERRIEGERRHAEWIAEMWRWVEGFTEVPPGHDAISALLRALLATVPELDVVRDDRTLILVGDREISVPPFAALTLMGFLEACSAVKPTRKGVVEAIVSRDEHGQTVRWRTGDFAVARVEGGYRVRLR